MKASHCPKHGLYAIAAVMILLLATSFQTGNPVSVRSNPHAITKEEPQPRMLPIAVADTDDDSIGEKCKTDLDQITNAFTDMAGWIDADMPAPKIISGASYSKAAVNNAIDNWLCSSILRAATL